MTLDVKNAHQAILSMAKIAFNVSKIVCNATQEGVYSVALGILEKTVKVVLQNIQIVNLVMIQNAHLAQFLSH